MRVFITGGTGMIGRRLARRLADRGDLPVILSRRSAEARRDPEHQDFEVVQGDPSKEGPWQDAIGSCDAVVNLAGQNVFSARWNAGIKKQIRDSRVYGAEHVVAAIEKTRERPKVMVQGSAIGYYGFHDDQELTESSPSGSDFLAIVCRELEEAANQVEGLGVRLATVRTGIVLAQGEGALGVMGPIFRWGGASPVGNGGSRFRPGTGRQWMSWIHVEDILGLFLLALDNPNARGPINGTGPEPSRNCDFSRALARTLHRPFLPVGPPDLALRVLLGEVADSIVRGQKVIPARAAELGYRYHYPRLEEALKAAFEGPPSHAEPRAVGSGTR